MANLKFKIILFSIFLFFLSPASFAANKCVDLFRAPEASVRQVLPKLQVVRDLLLLPTAAELRFAAHAKSIEKRLRGTGAEERKSTNVPEFEDFVTDVKRSLEAVKNSLPRRHFILHYKFSRLISKAESHLQRKSFIYADTILLAMKASNIFTEAIEVKEGKNPKLTSDESEDGVFTGIIYGGFKKLGQYIQKKDMYRIIYKEDRFVIPTMRALSLNDFLLVSHLNVAYVGVVDSRITYDGRVQDTPRSFLYHDFQHIVGAKTAEQNYQQGAYLNKVWQTAGQQPENIRIAMGVLLFYFTHELGRNIDETTIQSPNLDRYLKIISERRSDADDLGDKPEVRKVLLDGHSLEEAMQVLRNL